MAYHRAVFQRVALPAPIRQFLALPRFAILATVDPDGAPRQAVAWYLLDDDGTMVVNSRNGRRWPANLRREPAIHLAVLDPADPYAWVGLTGRVVDIVDDQDRARADILAMVRRYHPGDQAEVDKMVARFATETRVSFRIAAAAIYDHMVDE